MSRGIILVPYKNVKSIHIYKEEKFQSVNMFLPLPRNHRVQSGFRNLRRFNVGKREKKNIMFSRVSNVKSRIIIIRGVARRGGGGRGGGRGGEGARGGPGGGGAAGDAAGGDAPGRAPRPVHPGVPVRRGGEGSDAQRLCALVPARAHRHVERDPAAGRQAMGRRRRRRSIVALAMKHSLQREAPSYRPSG